jgi:hypothetical protein
MTFLPGQNFNLEIARGNVSGMSVIHKFGNAPDFDTTDAEITVWDGADDGGIDEMNYNYSSSADIDSIVSTAAGDTEDIEIHGLDTSYNVVTQTATLNGQTRVALGTSLIRVYRMICTGSTDLVGTISCYVNSSITAGVVDDSTKVRALITDGDNQTLMALYTIPNGKKGYLFNWYASTAGASKSSEYAIYIIAKPFGEVFQTKHVAAISDDASGHIQHNYAVPIEFAAKTDIEILVEATEPGVTGASISAGFDIVLVDD